MVCEVCWSHREQRSEEFTRFEDSSEDKCDDPAVDDDYTLINDKLPQNMQCIA